MISEIFDIFFVFGFLKSVCILHLQPVFTWTDHMPGGCWSDGGGGHCPTHVPARASGPRHAGDASLMHIDLEGYRGSRSVNTDQVMLSSVPH